MLSPHRRAAIHDSDGVPAPQGRQHAAVQTESDSLWQLAASSAAVLWVVTRILFMSVACIVFSMELRTLYQETYGSSSLFDVFNESWVDSMLFSHTVLVLVGYTLLSAYCRLCSKSAFLGMAVALCCTGSPWSNCLYYPGLMLLANASLRCTRTQSVDGCTMAMHTVGCYMMSTSFVSGCFTSLLSLATHAFFQHVAYAQIKDALEFLFASDTRAEAMLAEGRPETATMDLMPFINHNVTMQAQRRQLLEMRNALKRAVCQVLEQIMC